MQLDVLADGDIGNGSAEAFGKVGNGAQLIGAEQAVGEGDAEHEEPTGFSLATGAAGCSRSVSLRVNPPPLEVGAGPFRKHRVATKPGEFLDFIERGPRVLFALEPLDLLRLGLFPGWCRQ